MAHGLAAAVHLLSSTCLLVALSITPWSPPVAVLYWPRNAVDPSKVVLSGVYLGWLLVVAGYVSGVHHLILARMSSRPDKDYEWTVWSRWIDYAISSALMMVVIARLCGVGNVFLLVNIALIQSILMLATGCVEWIDAARRNIANRLLEPREVVSPVSLVRVSVLLSTVYIAGVWAAPLTAFYLQTPPAAVSVIVWAIFVWFALFAVVHFWRLRDRAPAALHATDRWYLVLSIGAKLQLQWTVYGGVVAATGSASVAVGGITVAVFIVSSVLALWINRGGGK